MKPWAVQCGQKTDVELTVEHTLPPSSWLFLSHEIAPYCRRKALDHKYAVDISPIDFCWFPLFTNILKRCFGLDTAPFDPPNDNALATRSNKKPPQPELQRGCTRLVSIILWCQSMPLDRRREVKPTYRLLLGCTKALVKAVDAASGVEHFLLAGVKRVARWTNI